MCTIHPNHALTLRTVCQLVISVLYVLARIIRLTQLKQLHFDLRIVIVIMAIVCSAGEHHSIYYAVTGMQIAASPFRLANCTA